MASEFMRFPSRRSVVYSTHGMVACTQPLAAQAGIEILRMGGNAADAAVAVAAVLSLTEPSSTGIGGDTFTLYYNPTTQRVHSLNGSGRSPQALTLSHVLSSIPAGQRRIPPSHIHAVTVPGAAAGWCDTVSLFGSGNVSLGEILAPAIALAEEGVPISRVSAQLWGKGEETLRRQDGAEMFLPDGSVPREGDIMRFPGLARTYTLLARHGRRGFYEGEVAQGIVDAVRKRGGVMTLEDLRDHGERGSEEMDPISIEVPWGIDQGGLGEGVRKTVWECAPNSQGLVALQTLGILEALQERGEIPGIGGSAGYPHNSVEYLHALITALRISFSDAAHYIGEPEGGGCIPARKLLDKQYLHTRSLLFRGGSLPSERIPHGYPLPEGHCDTAYLSTADTHGGACSFINSVFTDFGSGVIPAGFGFPLQNRGAGFILTEGGGEDHVNCLGPGKRPYHTIIPAMVTAEKRLHTVFGVMGGYMQPQGHVQVLLNMLAFGMDPQQALDAPRVCVGPGYTGTGGGGKEGPGEDGPVVVSLEVGMPDGVVQGLRDMGYEVVVLGGGDGAGRSVFGRGQIIRNESAGGEGKGRQLWRGGSDMRGDGACVGY